jgi:hypothetical protein
VSQGLSSWEGILWGNEGSSPPSEEAAVEPCFEPDDAFTITVQHLALDVVDPALNSEFAVKYCHFNRMLMYLQNIPSYSHRFTKAAFGKSNNGFEINFEYFYC